MECRRPLRVCASADGLTSEETNLPRHRVRRRCHECFPGTDEGTLLAFGWEPPGATNTSQYGEMCLTQPPWRLDDGTTWTPGPVLDVELHRVVANGDTLLGIGSRGEPGIGEERVRLYRSGDGETWTEEPFTFGTTDELAEAGISGGPEGILPVGDTLVVEGSAPGFSPIGRPYPALWTMSADGQWEEVPIGFVEDGESIDDMVAVDGDLVLVGTMQAGEYESKPVVWVVPADLKLYAGCRIAALRPNSCGSAIRAAAVRSPSVANAATRAARAVEPMPTSGSPPNSATASQRPSS